MKHFKYQLLDSIESQIRLLRFLADSENIVRLSARSCPFERLLARRSEDRTLSSNFSYLARYRFPRMRLPVDKQCFEVRKNLYHSLKTWQSGLKEQP
jgi:hypothetical protein